MVKLFAEGKFPLTDGMLGSSFDERMLGGPLRRCGRGASRQRAFVCDHLRQAEWRLTDEVIAKPKSMLAGCGLTSMTTHTLRLNDAKRRIVIRNAGMFQHCRKHRRIRSSPTKGPELAL